MEAAMAMPVDDAVLMIWIGRWIFQMDLPESKTF